MKWFNVPTSRRGLGLKFRKEQRVEDQIALIENHLKTLNGQAEVIFGAKGSALGDLELAQSYEGSVADVCYAAGTTVDHAGVPVAKSLVDSASRLHKKAEEISGGREIK